MIDDPGLTFRILKYFAERDDTDFRLSRMHEEAFSDIELERLVAQMGSAIDDGLLEARISRYLGGDAHIYRPFVTRAGRVLLEKQASGNQASGDKSGKKKRSRWLLENAPNILAVAHLGRIGFYLILAVVLFVIWLWVR